MLSVADLFVLSLVIISTQAGVAEHNPFYCYSEDPIRQWSALGGIQNPYEAVRGQNINPNVSACKPSKFWLLSRHGARNPEVTYYGAVELADLISLIPVLHTQILTNYNQGRTSLCASDFELLKNWQFNPNVTMETVGDLSLSGWKEMEGMAKRFQHAFPTILPSTYSPDDYFFASTPSERVQLSNHAFADGLFGVNGYQDVQFEIFTEPDLFLSSYSNCSLFATINNNNPNTINSWVEHNAFIQGPEYQQMVTQVSAKLGFHNSNVLRNRDIALLIVHCKYEQLLNLNYTDPSPFCAAFSVANAQVIEYSEDLVWYYRLGYGQPQYRKLYENLMCVALQDMLRFIKSNDVNDHKARIFNGHLSQVLILLHFDAFAGDAILTRHNFAQQLQRVWRSTEILAMAGNLAVIRYE